MSALDCTAYHDDDDDEEEFQKADKEEKEDVDYGGNSAFLVSNQDNRSRKVKNGNKKKKALGYMPPMSSLPRESRDTDKSAILRRDTMTSEYYEGQVLPFLDRKGSALKDKSFSKSILDTQSRLESISDRDEIEESKEESQASRGRN